MALIERLKKLNDDGSSMETPADATRPHIPIEHFIAFASEITNGRVTVAAVQTFFNMNAADITEFTSLRGVNTTRLRNVLILAEEGYSGYQTPAEIRSKLGI